MKLKHVKTLLRIVYHRNGASGEPFVAIEFTANVDRKETLLFATLFEAPRRLAVIDCFDISKRFDGTVFEKDLRALLKRWEESWDGSAYTWPRRESLL